MAIRTKTIEYSFPMTSAGLAADTRYEWSQITLYIPETSSRTFRSVILQTVFRDNMTTATNLTGRTVEIKLGAVAFDAQTLTGWNSTTGSDHYSLTFMRDVTSYFATNFGSGASQTCQAAITVAALPTINISAKLIITYDYDDTSATTRIKTVRIPLESPTAPLTDVLTEIGTNQIPNLSTFLPEASKVFRDIFFEAWSVEWASATTTFQQAFALDAEAEILDGVHTQNLNSDTPYYRIWQRQDMTTNATHAFKARSTLTNRFAGLTVVLVVTYEYNHSTSTTLMNSVVMGVNEKATMCLEGTSITSYPTRFVKKFFVEEPTTITLAQSGFVGFFTWGSMYADLNFRAGSQAIRTYDFTPNSGTNSGSRTICQRIDSGGAQGAGITLARGENSLTLDFNQSTGSAGANSDTYGHSFLLYLNYTSGKHASGDGVHAQTRVFAMKDMSNAVGTHNESLASFAPTIQESNYYLNDVTVDVWRWVPGSYLGHWVGAMAASGEFDGVSFRVLGGSTRDANPYGPGLTRNLIMASNSFNRFPNDPAARIVLTTARRYQFGFNGWTSTVTQEQRAAMMYVTYHGITFSIAKTVTGYGGAGTGISVNIRRDDTDEVIGRVTTGSGGSYSMVWYDDTIDLISDAREDATHVGRSDNFRAS